MTADDQVTGVAPYLSLNGRARDAIKFWKQAFDAEEGMVIDEADRVRHGETRINGSPVYVTDFHPDPGHVFQPTRSIALHLAVADGGSWMARGEQAGCRVMTPWQQMPFGGFGRLVDPFGVVWSFASPNTA